MYFSTTNRQFSFVLCVLICYMHVVLYVNASTKNNILKPSLELLQKESERLAETIKKCNFKSSIIKNLNNLRLNGKDEKGIACHIKTLKEDQGNGWIWSSLGQCYLDRGGTKFTSMANNCFKQASKLNGKLNKEIKEWHYLGPFVIGKSEVDGDPLLFYSNDIINTRFKKQQKFHSELVPNGELQWQLYHQNRTNDFLQIKPNVNWNDLISSLGSTGIVEWQGWVVSEFAVNDNNQNIVMQCLGIHTLYIDGMPITGDVYHRESFWFSVNLSKGIHQIFIRLRAKGVANFRCMLDVAKSNYEILDPRSKPDLWGGYLFSKYIALPISNLHSSKWLRIIKVSVKEQSDGSPILCNLLESKQFSIAPGQIRPITVELYSENGNDLISADQCLQIVLKLKVVTSDGQDVFTVPIRCRKITESFIFTFIDHDGSVQHGAGVKPLNECEQGVCPVLLTLHGTTVPAQNQADSYKRMEDKEYVFGANKAWLIAPTRHGAHNWEGVGAKTALTCMQTFCTLVSQKEWLEDKATCEHVIFAGHSMGGHGAWHLATHYPDKTLALISLAGWIKKEGYGDSNLFFRHDIANSFVDPAVKHIMEACIAENEVDRFVSNLNGIPMLARIGADDRTVHPYFVRRVYRVLTEWGVNVTYFELPRKEHWWWDTNQPNDGGCVNDPQIRDFMDKYSVIPKASNGEKLHNMYEESNQQETLLTYSVFNPQFGGPFRGIAIIQQMIPFRTSTIKIFLTPHAAKLQPTNVKTLVIKEPLNRPVEWNDRVIEINGQVLDVKNTKAIDSQNGLCLTLVDGLWSICDTHIEGRKPGTLGPARTVAESNFIIVIGTQGSDHVTKTIQQIAVYLANLFFLTSDAFAPIVKDSEISSIANNDGNLIIIGTPIENSLTQSYLDFLPFTYENGAVQLGPNLFKDDNLGVLSLAPINRAEKLALIIFGNSLEGLLNVIKLATPTIPPMTRSPFSNMVADYVITGPDFGSKGPGGYLCTGFWDNDWTYNPVLSSC